MLVSVSIRRSGYYRQSNKPNIRDTNKIRKEKSKFEKKTFVAYPRVFFTVGQTLFLGNCVWMITLPDRRAPLLILVTHVWKVKIYSIK